MHGCVFSVEEFSVYDGPGIRTTVFLKGCPLRCSWCHNPEGQSAAPEIIKSPNGCIGCRQCVEYSIREDGKLRYTADSIAHCPIGLLRVCGEVMESAELCEKVLKNQGLLQNGGVTFSGGEPLMQSEFLFSCLTELKGKIHTAVQTSGYCPEEFFQKALTLADYFLFDLKLADETQHRKYTGVSNKGILRNFAALVNSGKEFVIRIPLIPGVTDTEENLLGIIDILKQQDVSYVELMKYNPMAGGKYKMVGREYTPGFDEKAEVRIPDQLFAEHFVKFKVL